VSPKGSQKKVNSLYRPSAVELIKVCSKFLDKGKKSNLQLTLLKDLPPIDKRSENKLSKLEFLPKSEKVTPIIWKFSEEETGAIESEIKKVASSLDSSENDFPELTHSKSEDSPIKEEDSKVIKVKAKKEEKPKDSIDKMCDLFPKSE